MCETDLGTHTSATQTYTLEALTVWQRIPEQYTQVSAPNFTWFLYFVLRVECECGFTCTFGCVFATYLYFYGHLSISSRHEANEYGNERAYLVCFRSILCFYDFCAWFFFYPFLLLVMIWSAIDCLFSQQEMDQSLIKCETRKKIHQFKWSDAGKKNFSRPNLYCHRSAMVNDYIRKLYHCAYMHWYTGMRSIFKLVDEDYGCELE